MTKTSKLNDIAQIFLGVTFRSHIEAVSNGTLRVIQMRDLGDDNRVHFDRTIRVDHPIPKRGSLARWGDIIFRSRGQTHTAALLDQEIEEAVIVAAPLLLIRPNIKRVLPGYLLWWINRPASQKYFASRAVGTAVKMVGRSSLTELEVSLPPRKQQRVIEQIFNLAAMEQHLLERLKKRREKYIEATLTQIAKE